MYAPRAAGAKEERLIRASANMTRRSPSIATTSPSRCPIDEQRRVEMLTAALENIRFATTSPETHPITCKGT
jgi:hypothetical protein